MLDEEKFINDIENLKHDLAIENMHITAEDVNFIKKYASNEFTLEEGISTLITSSTEVI